MLLEIFFLNLKNNIGKYLYTTENKKTKGSFQMISHKYKCIFIHIPRTAGSSIEEWICGDVWQNLGKNFVSTKHLLASQAKRLYSDCWDDYFKFSVVRNPWDRMPSLKQFPELYDIKITENGLLDISGYKAKFGYPLLIENHPKAPEQKNIKNDKHKTNQVYLNMLDEPLDHIGMYEELSKTITLLKERLNIKHPFNSYKSKMPNKKNYREYYDEETKNEIFDMFKNDIEKFNYSF